MKTGGWDVQAGGLEFGLEAVLLTVAGGLVIVTIAARAARFSRRPRIGPFVMLVEGSLQILDRAVTAGPAWARRRIGALAFTGFWFVLVSHWLDLIPAITLQAPISDINVALALGVVALGVVHATAAKVVGARAYVRHWFSPVYLFPVKMIELVLRTITLGLRLFGVVFAGVVLVDLLMDLPPPAAVLPLAVWTVFDMVMAVVQAYIFAILTATYYNLALTNARGKARPAGQYTSAAREPAPESVRETAPIGAAS